MRVNEVVEKEDMIAWEAFENMLCKDFGIELFRQSFSSRFVRTDLEGSKYIDEDLIFNGPQKITIAEFNLLKHLPLSLTYFDKDIKYLKSVDKNATITNKIFAFKLPIAQTLMFWGFQSLALANYSPKENLVSSIAIGSLAWFLIEQAYHRYGHKDATTEAEMRFLWDLHISHHLDPDKSGGTVSPIAKNLILQAMIYFMLYASFVPNPQFTMAVITAQFTFYEFTHWLSHTTDAQKVSKVPVFGRVLSDIVGNHRQHHKMPDSYYAVSSGYFGTRSEKICESVFQVVNPENSTELKLTAH